VVEGDVEALIVSDETAHKGAVLNQMRGERGLASVKIVTVPMILAKDGKRISSTRIRNSEIDPQGNLIQN
jgi:pantetheine-phosphate adenylyltransferase